MTPMQFLALLFVGFCIGFYFLIVFGIKFMLKYMVAYPNRMAVIVTEDRRFKYHVLKPTGFMQSDWKLESTNPSKVRFKVRPFGIGKAHEMEWDNDDYTEFPSKDGNKVFVMFGLRNFDLTMGLKQKMLMQMVNFATANSANWQQKYQELEYRFDQKVNESLDRTKKLAPVYVKPKSGQQR